MPASLASQRVVVTGLAAVLSPATAEGDTMRPNLGAFLYVVNDDTNPHDVTVNDPRPGGTDIVVTVADGTEAFIGPIDGPYRDRNDGYAHISYDDVTSVTVAALVCPLGVRPSHPSGTALDTQEITTDGLVASYDAAAGGQKVLPGQRVLLHVKNGDGSSHSITLDDPTSVSPVGAKQFDPDVQVTITNGTSKFIGPIDRRFADHEDTNRADISWSATTSMTVAVLAIP